MKKHISTDEYMQCLGLLTIAKQKRKELEHAQDVLTKILDPDGEEKEYDYFASDLTWEDGSAMKCWETFVKDQKISVGGPEH